MYKQISNLKNLVTSFLAGRSKYNKFYSKVQDVLIDALLEGKQLVYIEDKPDFFLETDKVTDVLDCIAIQLKISADWKYVEKNDQLYTMVIKINEQEFEEIETVSNTKQLKLV